MFPIKSGKYRNTQNCVFSNILLPDCCSTKDLDLDMGIFRYCFATVDELHYIVIKLIAKCTHVRTHTREPRKRRERECACVLESKRPSLLSTIYSPYLPISLPFLSLSIPPLSFSSSLTNSLPLLSLSPSPFPHLLPFSALFSSLPHPLFPSFSYPPFSTPHIPFSPSLSPPPLSLFLSRPW